jgi:hypothetical protein
MRTWQAIYEDLTRQRIVDRFTLRQLIKIFIEESDWIGTSEQLVQLKALQWEITGIRPGNCTGCNLDVLKNMTKWALKYEQENEIIIDNRGLVIDWGKHNGTNSNDSVRHTGKRKNKVYSTDNK